MHPIVNIAVKAARAAGDIINRYSEQIDRVKVSHKDEINVVSEVDLKAEKIIIEHILKAYPEHSILSEEAGEIVGTNPDFTWIIDPLDGTSNYLHGFPFYAVSIAVKYKNRIEHAVVFDPQRQECFTATRGQGAQLNDRRMRVSKQTKLSQSILGTGLPFRNKESTQTYFKTFESLFGECAGIRRAGAAALELAYVAAGRLDGYWEASLLPWDMAASSLLIKEAGGLVGDFTGGELYLKTGNIVAGTPKVFKSLLQTIQPALKLAET